MMQSIPARGRLAEALRSRRPLILDGAMGTELARRGIPAELPLWSAAALLHHPADVLKIHLEYIEAGATIITANTFRTTARTFHRAQIPDRSSRSAPKTSMLRSPAICWQMGSTW